MSLTPEIEAFRRDLLSVLNGVAMSLAMLPPRLLERRSIWADRHARALDGQSVREDMNRVVLRVAGRERD